VTQQKHRVRGISRVGRAGVAALGIGAVLGMTGCSAGQVAQTAQELPAVNGAVAHTGKIVINDATLAYPQTTQGVYAKGSDIELALTIVNNAASDDELVDVSSDTASEVLIEGSTTIPARGELVVGTPGGSAASYDSNSEPQSQGDDEQGDDESTAKNNSDAAEDGVTRIALQDTTRPVRSGQMMPVTFTFADAGSVTTQLPVSNPGHDAGRLTELPNADEGTQRTATAESGGGGTSTGAPSGD